MERRASREPALVLPKPRAKPRGTSKGPASRSPGGAPGAPLANSAFLYRHIFLWADRADVIGARADQSVIVELFDDVRGPAADPRDREDGREQVHINAECVVGGSRIEVHIGVELLVSLYEVFDL